MEMLVSPYMSAEGMKGHCAAPVENGKQLAIPAIVAIPQKAAAAAAAAASLSLHPSFSLSLPA
jgi:hypothetical protein